MTRLRGRDQSRIVKEAVRQARRNITAGEVSQAELSAVEADVATLETTKVSLAGQLGGSVSSPDVRGLRTTTGPTLLTMAGVADGEYLKRNGTTIVGGSGSAGAGAMDDLTDVDTAGVMAGDMLIYDGSEWIPDQLPAIPTELDDLTDVDLSGASDGDVLTRVSGVWEPAAPSAGGGAPTVSHLGYNTVGGSTLVASANRQYNKKITVPSAGILLSLAVYLRVTSQFWMSLQAGVQSDSAGVAHSLLASVSGGQVNMQNDIDKWLTIPLNLVVAAGDYWLSFIANQAFTLYYDVGTDTYYDPGQATLKDGNLVSPTVTAHKYSIRAAFMATA